MIVDPLHDLADIQLAFDNLALDDPDTNPMVQLMTQMSRQLSALNIKQATTKKQNAMLLVSARKAKVDETVGKLTNPMSVRAVSLNFMFMFMVEDMLAVFKPDGAALVHTDLDNMRDLSAAAAVFLEEIVRLIQRDSEVHQLAKDSHMGWNLLPFLDEEETAVEERDSARLIKSKEVVASEKAYMSFHIDRNKTARKRTAVVVVVLVEVVVAVVTVRGRG